MNYEMILNDDRNDFNKILKFFTNLYATRKEYLEDHTTYSGFAIVANVTHISLLVSVLNVSSNPNKGGTMGVPEDEATAAYYDYVKGLEESLEDVK